MIDSKPKQTSALNVKINIQNLYKRALSAWLQIWNVYNRPDVHYAPIPLRQSQYMPFFEYTAVFCHNT